MHTSSYQISKIIAIFSGHKSIGVAKPGYVVDITFQTSRIGFQNNEN